MLQSTTKSKGLCPKLKGLYNNNMKFFKNIITAMSLFSTALFSLVVHANEPIPSVNVNGDENGVSIQNSVIYLIDESARLTAEQVWNKQAEFKINQNNTAWLANTEGSVWTKTIIANTTDQAIEVNIEYPFHQYPQVILFHRLLDSDTVFSRANSNVNTSADRNVPFPRPTFSLSLAANQSKEILLETYSDFATPRFTEFRLWSTPKLFQASNTEHIIFGLVVGLILLSALVSFALFKFLKERFFVWYSLFAISSVPVLGLTTGVLSTVIPGLDYHPLGTISMVVMMAAGIQFIRVYSNASYHSLKADKLLHFTLTIVLLALPFAIIGFHEIAMKIQQLAVFTFPVAIITAVYCGMLGEKQMSTMVLAKTLFFITLMVTNLQAWGFIKPSYGVIFLPTLGMVAQLICLIWAMYYKAKIHYTEGSVEDLSTISDAYEQAYALQEQVKQQNQMLKAAKEQAEFEARTDMLTHLPNRRAFMNLAKMAIAQANRQGKPLSFIAFDIDNFKLINDQYGHPAGDKTLKEVSDLTRSIIRASDFCGRIGGEEFMIGCHNNSLGDAYNLAERIRKAIESCVITFDKFEFSTTVSLGLAQVEEDDTLDSVIKKADEAMYISKEGGKNKVTHYAA